MCVIASVPGHCLSFTSCTEVLTTKYRLTFQSQTFISEQNDATPSKMIGTI